jgi:YD repeat-containing protein
MKRFFLFFCVAFSVVLIQAQLPSFEGNKSTSSVFLQKVIPPSPNAASLGKYGDQQINMFTGTSAVNIPIYEIKTNGYSLPLSLAYSTSGLRVTEAASWVGLGWSLGGTGVITRVVKGAPDGIKNPIDVRTYPLPLTYSQVNTTGWNYIHAQMANAGFDQEPDIFIVKAGKLSVKFYYDLNKRIQTIPYNNHVKIKFDGPNDQYVITDEDGSQYFFGGTQSSEITFSSNPSYAAYTSSWFLTKIVSPVGTQILFNSVKGTTFIKQDQYSESEEVKAGGSAGDCATPTPSGRSSQWATQEYLPVFLNSIETDMEIVYLTRSTTERADMPGDFALTDIKVYSKVTGKYEYNYSFNYSYFPQVSTICWGNTSTPQHTHDRTAICKRLRLDAFVEKGNQTNTTGFKTHQFQYSTKAVPSRCSLDQDFWGYYNGAGNTSLLPTVSDADFQSSSYNAVSRDANHNFSDAGMLQKIIYPTGGESNFVYEPNEINTLSYGPTFQTATASLSGISTALESSTTFTISSTQPLTINFTLSDPNLLDQGLQRKAEIIDANGLVRYTAMNFNSGSNGVFVSSSQINLTGFSAGTYTLKVSRNYSYSSFPSLTPLGIAASVKYQPASAPVLVNKKTGGFRIEKVMDKADATGTDINIKEFFYENPSFVADIKNDDCVSTYTRWFTKTVNNTTYQCFFKSRTTSAVQPIGSIQGSHIAYGKVTRSDASNGSNGKTEYYYSVDPDQGGYSLSPYYKPITSYDHRRGNLLTQIDYDATGAIKHIKANTYEYSLKYAGVFYFPFYSRDEPIANIIDVSLLPSKVISFSEYAIPSEWVRIKNTSETIYSGTNYATTISEYTYGNSNYAMPTVTKSINSKGDALYQNSKYPLDYKPTTTLSNEELERKFETDYQALFNSFVACNNAAANATSLNACYTNYQTAYDNLVNSRIAALNNYQSGFQTLANATSDPTLKGTYQLLWKNKLMEANEATITKNTTTELSKTVQYFKDFGGNILAEKEDKSYKAAPLQNEINYQNYDSKGNILQFTGRDNVPNSIVWGYKQMYPVAKVVGATYAEILTALTQTDQNLPYLQNLDGAALTTELTKLRNNLKISKPLAQVFTYTYAPLVGTLTETDPNAKSIQYEYDNLNRLKNIKDYQGNIVKNFQYNYGNGKCGANCYILSMQTFNGTNTIGYPVGVFNVNGQLIGNATTSAQFVTLWNGNATNQAIGTLAATADSLKFNLTVNAGKSPPPGVTGCRYYQVDISYNRIDAVLTFNGIYANFGDGVTTPLGSLFNLNSLPANTVLKAAVYSGVAFNYLVHSYPDNSLKTITIYHNDDDACSWFDNYFLPSTTQTLLTNLRGNLPQFTNRIGGSSYQQASMTSLAGITNWSSISSVIYFRMTSGDAGVTAFQNVSFPQNFMANNKDLEHIWTSYGGYYASGCRDTTFKLSRLKSDWNTYFTKLNFLVISDEHWNRENLSGLPNLKTIAIVAGTQLRTNQNIATNPPIPIPSSVIDNIIIQVAAGSGQTVTGGAISILGGGGQRTAASDAAVTFLQAKGWTITITQ